MPPKKKGKKSGSGQIDGVNTSSMTREQLEAYTHRLKNELEREREERNFFQLDRDKIRTFWEITQNELAEEKNKVQAKYYELEAPIEVAENAVRKNIEKMKYLQYEHHKKIGEIHLKAMQENFKSDIEFLKEIGDLRKYMSEKEEEYHARVQQLKMAHNQEISRMKNYFKNQEEEINQVNKEKFDLLKNDLEKKYKMELNDVTMRKDSHIKRIIEDTDRDFNKIKNYYDEITQRQLLLIDTLKNEVETLRKEIKEIQSKADDATMEKQYLKSELEKSKENFKKFDKVKTELYHCEKEKENLSKYKIKCDQLMEKLNQQKLRNDTLLMLNKTVTDEKNELWRKFENLIIKTQSEIRIKNALLTEHITVMHVNLKNLKQNVMNLIYSENFEIEKLVSEIEKIFQFQDKIVCNLQYEIERLDEMYRCLLTMKCDDEISEKSIFSV